MYVLWNQVMGMEFLGGACTGKELGFDDEWKRKDWDLEGKGKHWFEERSMIDFGYTLYAKLNHGSEYNVQPMYDWGSIYVVIRNKFGLIFLGLISPPMFTHIPSLLPVVF